MDRQVTPPKRVTSPNWGPQPTCKQALRVLRSLLLLVFFGTEMNISAMTWLRAQEGLLLWVQEYFKTHILNIKFAKKCASSLQSVFIHVASIYANLLDQKKAFA